MLITSFSYHYVFNRMDYQSDISTKFDKKRLHSFDVFNVNLFDT